MWRILSLGLAVIASTSSAQVIQFCQPNYSAVASVRVYNFRKSPVPSIEPSPVPPGVRVQNVSLPALPTPVPTQYATTTGCTGSDVGYVSVPADLTVIGPGLAVSLAGWAVSQDGVSSTVSNVVAKTPVPIGAPVLLP